MCAHPTREDGREPHTRGEAIDQRTVDNPRAGDNPPPRVALDEMDEEDELELESDLAEPESDLAESLDEPLLEPLDDLADEEPDPESDRESVR